MKDAFQELAWAVWSSYGWLDHSDENGKPLFVEPAHRFETPAAVETAWRINDQKKRKTGPTLDYSLNQGEPRMIVLMSKEHATLFQAFSEIDYSDLDAIKSFAMDYGLLGLEWESHINWAREICQMAEAIELANRDDRTSEDDKKLTWLYDRHAQDVVSRMEVTPKMRLVYGPRTLLAALWLQFGLGFVDGYGYGKCRHCQRMFEISVEQTGFRRHRAFCTDNCKSLNYQKRKRTALKLSAAKTRLRDIAKQTETKLATVRKWVKEAKQEHLKS